MYEMRATLVALLGMGVLLFSTIADAQQTPIPLSFTCDASPPADLAKGAHTFHAGSARAAGAAVPPEFMITWELACTNRVPSGKVAIAPRLNEQMTGLSGVTVLNIDQFVVFGKNTPELFLSATCQVSGHVQPTTCRLWLLLARKAADFDYVASFMVLGENGSVLAHGTGVSPGPKKTSSKNRILYDQRTGTASSRAVPESMWAQLTQDLISRGNVVNYHTHSDGRLTAARLKSTDLIVMRPVEYRYDGTEKQALEEFVKQGGAILVAGEWGPSIPSAATIDLLAHFGATYDNNTIRDPAHSASGQTSWVIYAAGRNFLAHPVVTGLKSVQSAAGASLSGAQWKAIIETDDDAMPVRRPAVALRELGAGRLMALGDWGFWQSYASSPTLSIADNRRFALRSFAWLLFQPLEGI